MHTMEGSLRWPTRPRTGDDTVHLRKHACFARAAVVADSRFGSQNCPQALCQTLVAPADVAKASVDKFRDAHLPRVAVGSKLSTGPGNIAEVGRQVLAHRQSIHKNRRGPRAPCNAGSVQSVHRWHNTKNFTFTRYRHCVLTRPFVDHELQASIHHCAHRTKRHIAQGWDVPKLWYVERRST